MYRYLVFCLLLLAKSSFAEYECSECSDPNAEYLENGKCVGSCVKRYPDCEKPIPSGCYCKDGFVKKSESNNLCVPISRCYNCTKNEEFQECGTACPITCANKDNPPEMCLAVCVEGCFCKKGLVRNEVTGKCVLPKDCPSKITHTCTDPNSYDDLCGNLCALTCKNKDAPPVCMAVCLPNQPGCRCRVGYAFNDKGICVKIEECPVLCPPGEIYRLCGYHRSCQNITASGDRCSEGCFCKYGEIRKYPGGPCILEKDCPTCSVNEEYNECGTSCPITCKNKDNPPQTCNYMCNQGCFCKEGYVRNEDSGKCVLPKECPAKAPKCSDPNAEFLKCKRCVGSCDNRNPICDKSCNPPGCYCKPGYIKKSKTDSTCIKETQCPAPKCTGPNEIFSKCDAHGCRNTCSEPDLITRCTYLPGCYPGCICKDGFLRNDKGICVSDGLCPVQCADPNSEFLKCKRCVGTCANRNPICDKSCIPAGCYCKPGYITTSNTDSTCIKIEDCPTPKPSKACGENEIWSNKAPVCPEQCDNIGKPKCKQTKPGCVCKPGFIRECAGGKCIPECGC